jgi:hypothetical protein
MCLKYSSIIFNSLIKFINIIKEDYECIVEEYGGFVDIDD